MKFKKLSFNEVIKGVKTSLFVNRAGDIVNIKEYAKSCCTDQYAAIDFDSTFSGVAHLVKDSDEWAQLLELYHECGIRMTHAAINSYMAVVMKKSRKFIDVIQSLLILLPKEKVESIKDILPEGISEKEIGKYSSIVKRDDLEYLLYCSIKRSVSFKRSKRLFDIYLRLVEKENPRMVSILLHNVKKNEFQQALLFLQDTERRYKDEKKPFSAIMYNNLLKRAPNVGEALAVLPYISNVQDYTISNILLTLKSRRSRNQIYDENYENDETAAQKTDPKKFFYAYDVVMRSRFKSHRKSPSPYILGMLYSFTSTPKQETFIRNNYLQTSIEEKDNLIDFSTTIASLRIKKSYRDIGKPTDVNDSAWGIFNRCRSFYKERKWYINSDLFSNMMRKIYFAFNKEPEGFSEHMNALRVIIDEDEKLINKDDYFLANRYAYDPQKNSSIFDKDGNLSEEFIKDMKKSKIKNVRVLNKVLHSIVSTNDVTFSKVWSFYLFIKDYYSKCGEWKELKPDIYTFTDLLRAVRCKDDYNMVQYEKDELYPRKNNENKIDENESDVFKAKMYTDCLRAARARAGLSVKILEQESNKKKETIDELLDDMKSTIDKLDIITPTTLNNDLMKIVDEEKRLNVKNEYKAEVYYRLKSEVLDPYEKKICNDVQSYVSMIKLSPGFEEAKIWIDKLFDKFDYEGYRYHLTNCRELAIFSFMAQYNIEDSVAFFEYWKKIMDDIGYEPGNPDSFTEDSDKPKVSLFDDDYDYYWTTRWEHLKKEMNDYCINGRKNIGRLKSIKEQIDVFDAHQVRLPDFTTHVRGHKSVFDFRAEIKKQLG